MPARTVEIQFLGSTTQLEAAMERAGLVAKGSGDAISDAFNSGSSKAGSALERLGKKAEGLGIPFASGLTVAGKHLDEATTKTGKLTSVMGELGKATVLAGGAMAVGVGVEAVKAGAQYESAQAKIQGATGQSTKAVKELTSAFGSTAGRFESSGEEMEGAFAGVAGQLQATEGHALGTAQAMRFMSSATELNTAVQGNLAETTAALSAVMQAFRLSASQAAGAADTLYNVSTRTDVPVGTLAATADKLHGRLGTLAPSLGDIGSLMVALAGHGVTGSRGVQVVNTALSTLVGGSEKTTKVLDDLGVRVFNQQGKFVGLQAVISQLQPKLAGLSEQQRVFAEKTLFGSGAYQIMGQVIQAGAPAFQKATDEATKLGTAHQAAAVQAHTLRGELETAKAAAETLGGDLGRDLIPEIKLMGKGLAEGIQWLEKHKEAAAALGLVIGGPLAAAVTIYATQKAASFAKGTLDMIGSVGKLGAKVAETVPQIVAKLGLIGSGSETTAAKVAASDAAIEDDNIALARAYGTTAGEVDTAGTAMVASADTTEAGVDAALGSTGVGLVLVGLGLAAVELEQHWSDVMKALESAAKGAANEIVKALNKIKEAAEIAAEGPLALRRLIPGLGGNVVPNIPSIGEGSGHKKISEENYGGLTKVGAGANIPQALGGRGSVGANVVAGLMAGGLSNAAANGVMKILKGESNLSTTATGSEGAYGIAQWLGSRRTGLESYASSHHESSSSLSTQIEYLLKELRTGAGGTTIGALNAAGSTTAAAKLFVEQFERPLKSNIPAILERGGVGSNAGISGLEGETANGKAKAKAESKAEAELKRVTTAGESLLKKYEAEAQGSTPSAIERALGVSTTGRYKSIPGDVQKAAETGRTGPLQAELGSSAAGSEAGRQEQKLIAELKATHKGALEQLASQLVAAHRQALAALAAEMVATERTRLGEQLKVQAAQEKDRTTLTEHLAANQLSVVKAEQAQQTNAMKAAATVMAAETTRMSDSFSAMAQSVEAATQLMADTSNGLVAGIKDQTSIEVSTLGERGQYGLSLIAQKLEVQGDQEKALYDQQVNAAKTAEDTLKATEQGVVAQKTQIADEMRVTAAMETAKAQQHLDAVTLHQAQLVTKAQEALDTTTLSSDIRVDLAGLAVTLSANASKRQQDEAAAMLKIAEGRGEKAEAKAAENLAGVSGLAAKETNAAENSLALTREFWAQQELAAQRAIAQVKGEGEVAIANAQRNVQGLEGTAAQKEAQREREVAVEKERAQTQYSGSGLQVNITGLPMNDAAAIASEVGWVWRTQLPA